MGNGLVRYDSKDYIESTSKLRRGTGAIGSLQIGEAVTIKTQSRLWKAIIVNLQPVKLDDPMHAIK